MILQKEIIQLEQPDLALTRARELLEAVGYIVVNEKKDYLMAKSGSALRTFVANSFTAFKSSIEIKIHGDQKATLLLDSVAYSHSTQYKSEYSSDFDQLVDYLTQYMVNPEAALINKAIGLKHSRQKDNNAQLIFGLVTVILVSAITIAVFEFFDFNEDYSFGIILGISLIILLLRYQKKAP